MVPKIASRTTSLPEAARMRAELIEPPRGLMYINGSADPHIPVAGAGRRGESREATRLCGLVLSAITSRWSPSPHHPLARTNCGTLVALNRIRRRLVAPQTIVRVSSGASR